MLLQPEFNTAESAINSWIDFKDFFINQRNGLNQKNIKRISKNIKSIE